MAANKTQATAQSVASFLSALESPRREECERLVALMEQATGSEGRMWGSGIVGFGDVRYKYESGREGDWFRIGFSPRKAALTLYLGMASLEADDLLPRLGRHTLGKGCLYLKKLDDADQAVLEQLLLRAAGRQAD